MTATPAGRIYSPLPVDNAAGFPQRFPFLSQGVHYQFTLYVDAPEWSLGAREEVMDLPDRHRFLVARVDVLADDGGARTVFLRKVVPSLEYRAGGLALVFTRQRVARRNLNGVGHFGTDIAAGVAPLGAPSGVLSP